MTTEIREKIICPKCGAGGLDTHSKMFVGEEWVVRITSIEGKVVSAQCKSCYYLGSFESFLKRPPVKPIHVIFKVSINERGLLELETADLKEENFLKIRSMFLNAKRVILDTKSGYLGTSICTTIDDSYIPPPIGGTT